MLAVDASNNGTMLGHNVVERDRRVHLEDIRRYVLHGVVREEDGWAGGGGRDYEMQGGGGGHKIGGEEGWDGNGGAPCSARAASLDEELADHQRATERQERLKRCQGEGRTILARLAGIRIARGMLG